MRDATPPLTFVLRAPLPSDALNALFAASWPDHASRDFAPVLARSLLWLHAERDGRLVAFVNVATDGGLHAFLLDPTVHPQVRRQGVGTRLVQTAIAAARAQGATWLHVDFEPALATFYAGCGFVLSAAGIVRLA